MGTPRRDDAPAGDGLRFAHVVRYLATLLLLSVVYFLAARLGLSMASTAEQVSAVWPPTGIALSAVLLLGFRVWPAIAVGAVAANLLAHEPLGVALGIACGNTLEALAGGWLLRRFGCCRNLVGRMRGIVGLAVLAALLSTALAATIGVLSLCIGRVQPWENFASLWSLWWLGDATGALVIAPAILAWSAAPRRWLAMRPRRLAQAATLCLGVAVTCYLVFLDPAWLPDEVHPLGYTIFAFIIWAGLKFGQRGVTTVLLITSAIAIAGTAQGAGPFGRGTPDEGLLQLQMFMAVLSITGLMLGAAIAERNTAEARRAVDHAVSQILAESSAGGGAVPRILQRICQGLGWQAGGFWEVDQQAGRLRNAGVWSSSDVDVSQFVALSRQTPFEQGIGLPGRVWAMRHPTWIPDVTCDDNFPRAAIAAREGLHAAFGFPILIGGEVVAVMEFFSREIQEPDDDLLEMLSTIGAQIGQYLERCDTERSLRESELRFRQLAENIENVYWMVDPRGPHMLYISPAYETVWGRSRQSLYEQPLSFLDSVHADDRPRVQEALRRHYSGQISEVEYRIVRPDGALRWVWDRGFPLKDEAGQVWRICGIAADITERRQREAMLRFLADAGETLSGLVDYRSTLEKVASLAVPQFADWCAVDIIDDDGQAQRLAIAHGDPSKEQRANELAQRYPLSGAEHAGSARVLRTGKAELVAEIDERMLRGVARDEEHLRLLGAMGLKSYVCVPLRLQDRVMGALTFITAESGRRYRDEDLAVAEDLAQRAAVAIDNSRLYQQVRDADRRKNEFLAMLAHELRNPLAPIRNGLDILAMEVASEHGEIINLMQQQMQHLVRLVDDLLDVSRIVRGRVELRRQIVEVSAVVQQAVAAMRPVIDARAQQLYISLPSDPVCVSADPVRLVQTVENLLHNAAKYTDERGRIELTVESRDGMCMLGVRDNGIGIEPELLPRVFDLFTQAAHSLDRSQGGLGIGLTLVRNLVEMHGGSVSAHSAGLGQGSHFIVRLPTVKNEAQVDDVAPQPMSSRRRVLVVDDNAEAAQMLALLLARLGEHQVEIAHDGPSALAKACKFQPEIVLLDIGLPGMNGYEVGRKLRGDLGLHGAMLVAVTGYGQEQDRRRSLDAGFDEHLVKPVHVAALQKVLCQPQPQQ